MKTRISNQTLRVALPLIDPPKKSGSGKTFVVATSRGPRRTALKVGGKNVIVIVTAYIHTDKNTRQTPGEIAHPTVSKIAQMKRTRTRKAVQDR